MINTTSTIFSLAVDGNEANVKQRVGSNVYAWQILHQLEQQTRERPELNWTILLAKPPVSDLPKPRMGWQYVVLRSRIWWTQWALPIYLFKQRKFYDLFYTPGHYAPRLSSVPYISSVMDLGFIRFPNQFKLTDWWQLSSWTKYSVKKAKQIITISEFQRQEIAQVYHLPPDKISVSYPAVSLPKRAPVARVRAFIKKHQLQRPYFLYLGTLQPRKNLVKLITAYELFYQQAHLTNPGQEVPRLIIAGKIGWLADEIVKKINASPQTDKIKVLGFVDDSLKKTLYEHAIASLLVSFYEGFGIPALESLSCQTLPIVANASSLPEVVGDAGLLVDPYDPQDLANAMMSALTMSSKDKAIYKKLAREQVRKFSWSKSARVVLAAIESELGI